MKKKDPTLKITPIQNVFAEAIDALNEAEKHIHDILPMDSEESKMRGAMLLSCLNLVKKYFSTREE